MTALLDTLAAVGIVLRADGERLRYTAPVGALTPELRRQIAERRAELLAALTGHGCPRCGRPCPTLGAWCDNCLDTTSPRPTYLRYRVEVRWARERGWLRVRDPFTGEWHEIAAKDAPRSWLDDLRRGRT